MIVLSDGQLDEMRASRMQDFATELAERARRRHEDACKERSDKDLRTAMEAEIEAARAVGLASRRELKRFTDLAMTFGLRFSTDAAWAAKIFANTERLPEERLTEVEETGVFVLRAGV